MQPHDIPMSSTSPFNPLVALQSLLSADAVGVKQRVKAAHQLEEYLRLLHPTPDLVLFYEPYLPLLTEILVTGDPELQSSVLVMLQTLSSHNPTGFGDWIARNMQVGNEPWFVQWSYALLLQTEARVPLKRNERDELQGSEDQWEATCIEMKELDQVVAQVMLMWRTLLDHTEDAALVDQVVQSVHDLMVHETRADQWKTLLLKKLQIHFVDIADVFIGWMMSTGPHSLLREEILALLHEFGRLWADNSVFSLQLLTSFADEIVNLCDLWKDHQEGDDDRLSTLLVCFMMVAQCVPDLALPADGGAEIPFIRVLHRVASCSQPDYSLFCLANCSEYLVTMSYYKPSKFPPLSVAAVRFLVYHCAVQSQMHDSEVGKLSKVMENACKLASANFCSIKDPRLVQITAIGCLEDDMPIKFVKKGSPSKRVRIVEWLFQLKLARGVTYITQLCLQLVWVGGIGALKALGVRALQRLNARQSEKGNSCFLFAATCFILASRNPEKITFAGCNRESHIIAMLGLVSAELEKQNNGNRQHPLTPRQLCLMLKMACAFVGAVSQWNADQGNAAEIVNGVSLQMLESASTLLASVKVVGLDHRTAVDLLKVVDAVLSRTERISGVPQKVFQGLVKAVNVAVHCSSVRVREEGLRVLKTLTSRAEARLFACKMFELSLDLVLDHGLREKVISCGMSDIARWALLNQDEVHTFPRQLSQDLHPSFAAADFENMMSLFQNYECNEAEWNRVYRQIVDRNGQGVVLRNADVLLSAVHQAAGWCVQHRLRTHFGGPAQSFAGIERLLQEYSDRMQYVHGSPSQRSDMQWMSNWLLLEFMSALEMRITGAVCSTEGEQSNVESENHKTALFYRTNKVVCDDWLARIRPYLIEMSKNGSSYELCRYHSHAMATTCYSKLSRLTASCTSHGASEQVCNELRQAEKDMDVALFSLCRCHVDAKDADSILGFQKWGDSMSSVLSNLYQSNKGVVDITKEELKMPLFRWLNAMRYEAEMRYEDAAAEYETLLQPLLADIEPCSSRDVSTAKIFESPMRYLRISPHALLGCFKQCAKCYASLREWTKLRSFVFRFMNIARSLSHIDDPIERDEAICNWNDTWSDEIDTICRLEREFNVLAEHAGSEGELKIDPKNRAALALRVWSVYSNSVAESSISQLDNIAGQLSSDLIPLALQPSPWNGYAGEKIGKRAEETILRTLEFSHKTRLGKLQQTDISTKDLRFNHTMYDCAVWSQPFCTPSFYCLAHDRTARSADVDCLHLMSVARLTRKQHNFIFAQHLLKEAGAVKDVSQQCYMAVNYEKAKLLEAMGMEDEGRRLLQTQCEIGLCSIGLFGGQESATARSILRLARAFAKVDGTELSSPATSCFLQNTLTSITNLGNQELLNDQNDLKFLPQLQDAAAYKCHVAAIAVSPKSANAWVRYSHWCYDQGKQEIIRLKEQNGFIHLDSTDEARIYGLLDEIGISEPDRDLIVRAFCHFLEKGELIGQRLDAFHQLCTERAPPDHNSDAMNRLVQLQQLCHSKILRFHLLSAYGYGRYLTVLFSDPNSNVRKHEITMVALRLLGLLTMYGTESDMVSSLEDVFSFGPVIPWSYIVPQLIARAHHPVAAVSSLICLILKRLAHHSPHAIVYPTVIDSMEAIQKGRGAVNTFAVVLHELQNVSYGQVEGVRLLISELRRISVLWDEAWISTLMTLAADVARRTNTLEKEATRVNRNATLSASEKSELAQRKLVAIMKPILVLIDRLWNETCGRARNQPNVSPHERKFLKEYGGMIEQAAKSFRDHCSSELQAEGIKTPQELWQPFAKILKALMNAAGRRDQLPLHDISPAMASASRELVLTNMPGILSGHSDPITIHRVIPFVTVLQTKTKPKSLGFVGSDGKTHRYLLKAREDLRLDERIMQFLRLTNDFLRADAAAAARDLSAQNYSVIPLSKNAGLIQMMPDVVPLFQVHASRSEYEAANGRVAQNLVAASPAQQQPPPPTAQFYARLKQHGITNVSPNNRAQWPFSVLKQVYLELVAQRPRNVLLQEILLRSENLRESWMKSGRFSKSLAVMSVLGYIVGLGDRHLDNILLCVNSGDVLHIDHNVCFDKGRRLKVPEIVPFRLTPMLQDALGITGVEGKFRVAFETTLRVVRSDDVRKALLTLLEAFVYSPLVEWVSVNKRQERSGNLKARLEANVNLSLFLSRAEERRQDTIDFGRQYEQSADIITRILKEAIASFADLLEQRKRSQYLEKEEQMLFKEVLKIETKLYTYRSAHHAEYTGMEDATAKVKEMSTKIASFASECFARHQQVETWRQKSINFAETDPEVQLNAVTRGVDLASFQEAHVRLSEILAQSRYGSQQKDVLAALESKCRLIDTDVKRLRIEIEEIALYLIPCLSSYSHWRKELDACLDLELETSAKDVYFDLWNRCTECLRGLTASPNEETATTVANPPITHFRQSLESSSSNLDRLNGDDLIYSNFSGETKEDSYFFLQVDKLLQEVWNALSAIKLSNAQGQRLMKLAGASWIINVMGKQDAIADAAETGAFTPILAAPSEFQRIVTVSYACSTLLDLVSTPKGLMRRLRGNELLEEMRDHDLKKTYQGAGQHLHGFIDALQAVGLFAIVLQEEFISNLHGTQWDENACQEFLRSVRGMSSKTRSVMDTLLMPSAVNSENSLVHTMLQEHPAIRNVFAAALRITQKVSAVADFLQQESVVKDEEADRIRSSSCSSWTELVLNFITLISAHQPKQRFEEEARALWSNHMDTFVSNCVVRLLRYLLSSIISLEWKFDFFALAQGMDATINNEEQVSLNSQWFLFSCSQIPDILPSILSNDASKTDVSAVNKSVAGLMTVCEEWWSQKWRMDQSDKWRQRISTLRTRHERRLRYAAWLAVAPVEPIDLAETPSLSRVQLLTFLSSQVPRLNALLSDQIAVEASALELAQQMDYLASNLNAASPNDQQYTNDTLHDRVQLCYTNAAALFDYGRSLADLVQGISVVETSSSDFTRGAGQMELEVNVVGKKLLHEAFKATVKLQSYSNAVSKVDACARALDDEIERKRAMYNIIAFNKFAAKAEFFELCTQNKSAVVETSRVLWKHVREMRMLLKKFDKIKAPLKQTLAAEPENIRSQRHLQAEKNDLLSSGHSSPRSTMGYSFMENDRLVNILLRSIQSVKHLQQLEGILERHGKACTEIRETIAQIGQALSDFDTLADQLLPEECQDQPGTDPDTDALLSLLLNFIEALRGITKELQPLSNDNVTVDTTDETLIPLFMVGRNLVRECVKLFFKATEMADRLSSAEEESHKMGENVSTQHLNDEDEEQHEHTENSGPLIAIESGNSVVLGVDSGDYSHDTTVSSPCDVEEKSQYGLQVLKRIEEKLSGTVTEMAHAPVLTVEQQASWLIDEATNTDNLCVMYEGWTPWI